MLSDDTIARPATALHRVLSVTLVVLPAVVVALLARDLVAPGAFAERFPQATVAPGAAAALAIAVLGLLPLAAMLWALAEMRALFGRYRRGEVLSAACAAHFDRIGLALAALVPLGVVAHTAQVLVATWSNPPGQRMLALSLGSDQAGLLLAAVFLMMIGRIMRRASRIAAENAAFV